MTALTGSLREIHSLTRSSMSRQLLRGEPLAVAEVEAQLVGADVGARLADVAANPLAQGGLEQVGGGVVALGGMTGDAVHASQDRLARVKSPRSSTTSIAWSSPSRNTWLTRGPAVAVGASDRAGVGDLAAAGRIEGRLGQLDQIALPARPSSATLELRATVVCCCSVS